MMPSRAYLYAKAAERVNIIPWRPSQQVIHYRGHRVTPQCEGVGCKTLNHLKISLEEASQLFRIPSSQRGMSGVYHSRCLEMW
jgi:hypothetical protein